MNLDDIGVLHEYNRFVRQELADPLTHSCGTEYTVRANPDGDTVYLQCFSCGTQMFPGLADQKAWQAKIDDIKAKRKL